MVISMKIRNLRSKKRNRQGAVVVECAFAIPLILLLTLGTLDICDGIYLKKKALIGAYEGARVAVGPDSSDQSIRSAVADYLDSRNIKYDDINSVVEITADPTAYGEPQTLDLLDPVTVSVSIDLDKNGRLPFAPFRRVQGPNVTAQVSMLRERQ